MSDTHLLAPCPDSPNCVSSLAKDEDRRVAPLQVAETRQASMTRLQALLRQLDRVEFDV
ncbi:MAG TPA: DUF1499 domain-containing protein, partial [Alcanivorax sp.]|nr:DUF1499 domain-containing protein [Alcanivorax sp.]